MLRVASMRLALLVAMVSLPAGMAVAGPSFDCAKARLPIEQALCADTTLGDLEGEMSRLYEQRLAAASAAEAKTLRSDMGFWLAALTKDCGIPRAGRYETAAMERTRPCLTTKYRARIAALQPAPAAAEPAATEPASVEPAAAAPPDATAAAAESASTTQEQAPPPPAAAEPVQTAAAPAATSEQVPEAATASSWRVLPFGKGLVAIIAQEANNAPIATASVYCDSQFQTEVPVFLYRMGSPVPTSEEVEKLNRAVEGVTLKVDGAPVESASRRDLGHSFSGFQLLPDGTLSYMLLIDPSVLESILHGDRLDAEVHLPPAAKADPRYTTQTFPLKNSRKAIEAALKRCV
jgi:uncharacterized protein